MNRMRLGLICLALSLFGMNGLSATVKSSCGYPPQCSVNSDCDATCGPGFGTCHIIGTCYRLCLCSLGGS